MAGFLIHEGATVICSHGGQATPAASNPRVMVSGQPTVLLPAIWQVAGCPLTLVPPCVTAQGIVGTERVLSGGQPLVVQGGVSTCLPTGTPLLPTASQTRVKVI